MPIHFSKIYRTLFYASALIIGIESTVVLPVTISFICILFLTFYVFYNHQHVPQGTLALHTHQIWGWAPSNRPSALLHIQQYQAFRNLMRVEGRCLVTGNKRTIVLFRDALNIHDYHHVLRVLLRYTTMVNATLADANER